MKYYRMMDEITEIEQVLNEQELQKFYEEI